MEEQRKDLEDLHEQLGQASATGDEKAAEYREAVGQYLAGEAPDPEEDDHLHGSLGDMLRHFEADHPELSATVQKIIDGLTASGL